MKAVAVFPETREVKLIDVAEPRLARPTEVRLRMLEVGVCGTDKELCTFQYGMPPAGSDHMVSGTSRWGRWSRSGRRSSE